MDSLRIIGDVNAEGLDASRGSGPVDVVDEETKAAIQEAFRQGEREDAFWAEHYQALVQQYPKSSAAQTAQQRLKKKP